MARAQRAALLQYGSAVAAVLVATFVRELLDPVLGEEVPFVTYFVAVVFSAWYGGWGPAVLSLALGTVSAAVFVIPPEREFLIGRAAGWVALGVFVFMGGVTALLTENLRAAEKRAEVTALEALAQRERLWTTLTSIGDGVIVTDESGRVRILNPMAESLTGWSLERARGQPLSEVFHIVNENTRRLADSPVTRVLREGVVVGLANNTVLIANDGAERPVDDSAAPIRDGDGAIIGVVLVFRDVTARRRAERIRGELAAIVESSEDAIVGTTLQGTVTSWNAGAELMYGYTAEEMLGQPIARIIPPEQEEGLRQALEGVWRGEVTGHFETIRRCKDGRLLDVSVNLSPIRNAEGEIVGVSGVHRDIGEQKRIRRELQRLNRELQRRIEEFQTMLEVAPVGLAVAEDPECRRIWGNHVLAELLHLPTEANISLTAPPEERPTTYQPYRAGRPLQPQEMPLQRATATGEAVRDVELDILREDGARFVLLSYAAPLFDEQGRVRGGFFAGVDITERRRMERELFESEERFHTLADNISQLAWMQDADGSSFWYNRRWYEYTGTSPEEMQGRGWRTVHHPEHVQRIGEKFRRCFETGEPFEDTFPLRRRDGVYRWFLTRAVPIRDDAGRIVRWFGTNTDITDLMEMEQALKEADRRKDEFLAMLSHELRNPLAPIRNGLELLSLDVEHNETVEMMKEQVDYLVRLVDDLLDLSRIMQGRVQVQKEPVQLSRVVHRAVEMSRSQINANNNDLQVALPSESLWVEGDGVRLAQVITNLLNNAVKYSEAGSRIWLSVDRVDGEAELRVRDEGVGIDPDFLPEIFELFSQARRSMDRSQGGLGIGLTLVHNLVELHGGTITPYSEGEGRGSEFTVRLPLLQHAEDVAPVEVHPTAEAPQPVEGRSILIVDDNPAAGKMLGRLLERLGDHEIRIVDDGPDALKTLNEHAPEIVFLDIGLPGMTGYEVAERIRQRPEFAETLLVALTGYGQQEDRRRSREAGFDEHLVKPPGLDELKHVLTHPRSRPAASRPPSRGGPPKDGSRTPRRTDSSPSRLLEKRGGTAPDHALQSRLEQLEAADRRKNRFLGKLAHEVGNLVAPVQLLVRVIERSETGTLGVDEVREMLQEHVPIMNRFYEELRRISRIARGMTEVYRRPVELTPVVEEAVASIRPGIEKRSQQLTVSLPETPPPVTGDPEHLGGMLRELLANASRFSDRGRTIALAVDCRDTTVEIRVRDEGSGIPEEQVPEIFKLFVRGDGEPDFGDSHFGVGLTYVRQVVEAHGGQIEVHSDGADRGSEFLVRLPMEEVNKQ